MAAVTKTMSIGLELGPAIEAATKELLRREVLVGIPGDSERQPEPGEKNPPSNAVIAYVQENGCEERGIPARPFLFPGIEAAKEAIVKGLQRGAQSALDGNVDGADIGLGQAGLVAQASVKKQILSGNFAPLAESTLKARARHRTDKGGLSQTETSKAARRELAQREAGVEASTDARPLYDTHSMFNAITYVVQDKGKDGG